MSLFIKSKEKDVYPSEGNIFAIISLILPSKEYLIIKILGKQQNLSLPIKSCLSNSDIKVTDKDEIITNKRTLLKNFHNHHINSSMK